jgi:hypothetical protein
MVDFIKQLFEVFLGTEKNKITTAITPVARDALLIFHREGLIDSIRRSADNVLGEVGTFSCQTTMTSHIILLRIHTCK